MDNICTICGDDTTKKYMYTLNCSHTFHYECLVNSFSVARNRNCPLCRTNSDLLPLLNGSKKSIKIVHFDINSSIKDLETLNSYTSSTCDFILTRGKNTGNQCNKTCVIGFYKCSKHL